MTMETEQQKMGEFHQQLEEMVDYMNYCLNDLSDDDSVGLALYHIVQAKQALSFFKTDE